MSSPETKTEKEILEDAFGVLDACGHERLAYEVNQIIIRLKDSVKAQWEQQERTNKVLADSVHGIKQTLAWNKRLDELQAENKALRKLCDTLEAEMDRHP